MDDIVAWAPYLIGGGVLLSFPLGRRILGFFWSISLGLLFLLLLCEPDLSESD